MLANSSVYLAIATILILALARHCTAEPKPPPIVVVPPIPITPDELQRLKAAAELSGLKDKELDALAKVVQTSKLSKEQLKKLEEAIVQHGHTPLDLKKLAEQLSKVRKARDAASEDQDERDYDWNNPKSGFDWLFKAAPLHVSTTDEQVKPVPLDLKKHTEELAEVRKARDAASEVEDEKDYDWSNPKSGFDWLFKATSPVTSTDDHVVPSIPITPDEFQRIKAAADLAGLKDKELDALTKVVQTSKLSKEQLKKLEEAIVQHGHTPLDLKKLAEQLSKVRKARDAASEDQDERDYDWNNPKSGFDWLFKATPPVTTTDDKVQASNV